MRRYDMPLPAETLNAMYESWHEVVERKECAAIMSLSPWDRHYRVRNFLDRAEVEDRQSAYVPIYLRAEQIEEEQDFKALVTKKLNQSKGKQLVLMVLDGEWLLEGLPHLLPIIQELVTKPYRQISFMVFFETYALAEAYAKFMSVNHPLRQNELYMPLYARKDMDHFLQHMAQLYGIHLGKKERGEICRLCGGHIWLVTEAIRYYQGHHRLSFDHEAMEVKLQTVWERLNRDEQNVLDAVISGKPVSKWSELEFLEHIRLVQEVKGNIQITVPLLAEYVETMQQSSRRLTIKDNKLYVGQVCIDSMLNSREQQLAKFCLEHTGEVISRDKVADVLWGENPDSFSDWALNQVVKRFRDKLRRLQVPGSFLETRKSVGFYVAG